MTEQASPPLEDARLPSVVAGADAPRVSLGR
jgi:hypothetical protein